MVPAEDEPVEESKEFDGDKGCDSISSSSKESHKDLEESFSLIENPKEQYLILIVHGIGTVEEW